MAIRAIPSRAGKANREEITDDNDWSNRIAPAMNMPTVISAQGKPDSNSCRFL
jgi:hypothetical protein